jgi:hypothetical protein
MLTLRARTPSAARGGSAPRVASVVLAGALALAACSSGTSTTSANGSTASNAATASTVATAAPGTTGSASPGSTPAAAVTAKGEVPERFKGYRSKTYADDALWLCKPGIAQNFCLTQDLDSTIVKADGTTAPVARKVVQDAPVDCFYVYPTVNLAPGGGNKLDLSQSGVEQAVLRTQGARFTETCNVYAPLYRQMNLSAYAAPEAERKKADDLAYGDVLDAFKQYMANDNKGKPFVLIGHSQGSGHLAHLLQDEFDNDPSMQSHLVSALLIGGFVVVPPGKDVGGTFKHLPLCRSTTQTSCIVAFNSFGTSSPTSGAGFGKTTDDGMTGACVNPAAPGGGAGALQPFIPDHTKVSGSPPVATPFAQFPEAMTAECKDDGTRTYLAISAKATPGDPRDVSKLVANQPGWGLHITEFNLTMGNLIELVRSQVATVR